MENQETIMLDDSDDLALMRFAFKKPAVRIPFSRCTAVSSGEGEYADRKRYPLPCLIKTVAALNADWISEHCPLT